MHTGKRVLITAAASGIGLAISRGFAAEGVKVHVCDISEDALRTLKQSYPSITSTLCDVSDRSSVERLVTDATPKDPADDDFFSGILCCFLVCASSLFRH